MTMNIIALGESAKHWDGSGPSIGVNDAGMWGHPLNYLLILNTPNQFNPERLEHIKNTKCDKLYTDHASQWEKYIPAGVHVHGFNSRQWSPSNKLEKISKNYLYHSKTSTFAAISLAFSWGFTNIILWGVDFKDHKIYKPGNDSFINEFTAYKTFWQALQKAGVNLYLGHEGSNLNFLPIWQQQIHKQ